MIAVITTKDQFGGIYNSYSTGARDSWLLVSKPCPWATPSDSVCYCHKSLAILYGVGDEGVCSLGSAVQNVGGAAGSVVLVQRCL